MVNRCLVSLQTLKTWLHVLGVYLIELGEEHRWCAFHAFQELVLLLASFLLRLEATLGLLLGLACPVLVAALDIEGSALGVSANGHRSHLLPAPAQARPQNSAPRSTFGLPSSERLSSLSLLVPH